MLAGLRLDGFVGGDDEEEQIDSAHPCQHVLDEAFVARNIDKAQAQFRRQFEVGEPQIDGDAAALFFLQAVGAYDSLQLILFAEAAAAFEELTLSGGLAQLKAQVPDAWPNLFRQARFLSAVDFVQAGRLRRKVAQEMARIFSSVDLLLVPSMRDEMLTIGNFTGHPSLTLRAGFVEVSEARSDWAPDPAHPLPRFSQIGRAHV